MHTTVSVRRKMEATARSRSSAWAAALAKRTLQRLPPLRHRANPSGTGLIVPNTTTTIIIVETPHKNALRPSNVRAAARAADTLRRRGRSPCGSVVRTPPRASQVPRDVLRHRGVDGSAILYGGARGSHEDYCLFLSGLTRVSFRCFRGFQAHFLIRIINSLSLLPTRARVLNSINRAHRSLSLPVVASGPWNGHVRFHGVLVPWSYGRL